MTRKLVTIQKVVALLPIEGADRIEICQVLGWQVVVQKGIHNVGDLVVFYEIDSFLNAEDKRYASFEERFINWEGKRGMRLKSIKLRKTLSQGLVMPLREFPEIVNPVEGMDVTEILKIEKWEKPEDTHNNNYGGSTTGKRTRPFPYFIRKTDQERVQNMGAMVGRCLDEEFEATIKKDGSSMTVFRVDPTSVFYKDAKELVRGKMGFLQRVKHFITDFFKTPEAVFGVCSRNMLLDVTGDSNFHKAVEKYGLYSKLEDLAILSNEHKSVALQGELLAPNIQGNYEKVQDVEWQCFDIYDISAQEYVLPYKRRLICGGLGIPHVTVLDNKTALKDIINCSDATTVVQKCLDYAEGDGDAVGVKREGVVYKSESRDFSFKAISNSYLLKTGK